MIWSLSIILSLNYHRDNIINICGKIDHFTFFSLPLFMRIIYILSYTTIKSMSLTIEFAALQTLCFIISINAEQEEI